jgi:hypothetical protein
MQDVGIALRRFLLDDSEVDYFVEGRVYVEEMTPELVTEMPKAAIVLTTAGGADRNDFSEISTTRFDVWSYGSTRIEAAKVDRALWDALHKMNRETREETLLHSVVLAGGPTAEKEPAYGWPVNIRSISVKFGTESTE